MSGSRIFVTGATGVIGRRVVPRLVAAGHAVAAVGRSPEKRAALERQGAAAVDVDLRDAAALRRALDGHAVVLNLATHMPPSTNRMLLPGAWRENDRVRREGSAALVDAALAAGVSRSPAIRGRSCRRCRTTTRRRRRSPRSAYRPGSTT